MKRNALRKLLGREPTQNELLSAYNAGEGRVQESETLGGCALPDESTHYIHQVQGYAEHLGPDAPGPQGAGGSKPAPGPPIPHRVQVDVSGTFLLRDPNTGTPYAATSAATTVSAPMPYGGVRGR